MSDQTELQDYEGTEDSEPLVPDTVAFDKEWTELIQQAEQAGIAIQIPIQLLHESLGTVYSGNIRSAADYRSSYC